MEKKATIISIILVIIIVACASGYIVFSGMIAKDYNYVQIEVNPRVEFLCDKKFNVVSVYPLNHDAEIILCDIDLVGEKIEEATKLFLEECSKVGFIDVNGNNNATNITVIDGISQALDVHVTKSVYDYFKKNEIMCAVTETYEDRSMFDEKKKNQVQCSNKYKLIKTIMEENKETSIEQLKKLKEVELVDIVQEKHASYQKSQDTKLLKIKQTLIENNKLKYNTHQKAITNNTQQEFNDLFDKFQKLSTKKHFENFEKQYNLWHKDVIY